MWFLLQMIDHNIHESNEVSACLEVVCLCHVVWGRAGMLNLFTWWKYYKWQPFIHMLRVTFISFQKDEENELRFATFSFISSLLSIKGFFKVKIPPKSFSHVFIDHKYFPNLYTVRHSIVQHTKCGRSWTFLSEHLAVMCTWIGKTFIPEGNISMKRWVQK